MTLRRSLFGPYILNHLYLNKMIDILQGMHTIELPVLVRNLPSRNIVIRLHILKFGLNMTLITSVSTQIVPNTNWIATILPAHQSIVTPSVNSVLHQCHLSHHNHVLNSISLNSIER